MVGDGHGKTPFGRDTTIVCDRDVQSDLFAGGDMLTGSRHGNPGRLLVPDEEEPFGQWYFRNTVYHEDMANAREQVVGIDLFKPFVFTKLFRCQDFTPAQDHDGKTFRIEIRCGGHITEQPPPVGNGERTSRSLHFRKLYLTNGAVLRSHFGVIPLPVLRCQRKTTHAFVDRCQLRDEPSRTVEYLSCHLNGKSVRSDCFECHDLRSQRK